MANKIKKILLSGGGTVGSVTPLLAIVDELKKDDTEYEYLWLGTKTGPEREIVEREGIKFTKIASGKLRRYFSIKNFTDIFFIKWAFIESLKIILSWRPDIMISAGSFVSVPVAWACFVLRVPVLIHQQDARAGLANKLMAPFARVVTVTFNKSLKDYPRKGRFVGNPIRKEFVENKINRRTAYQKLGLRSSKPIVLIMGGGTGALEINKLVAANLEKLTNCCQIIHLTGKDKDLDLCKISAVNPNYKCFEFLDIEGMIKVYTVADIIVSRCGMNALTEISYFKKPAILIPMPDSHQEDNAQVFEEEKGAIVLNSKNLSEEVFVNNIKNLVRDLEQQKLISENCSKIIKADNQGELAKIVKEYL